MDRRALIIGSWLAKGRDRPTPQKVKSITTRWQKLCETYRFHSLVSPSEPALPFLNTNFGELTSHIDQRSEIVDETELLIYFLGHSTTFGEDDLRLILSIGKDGQDRHCTLSALLTMVYQQTGIRKLIVILDTCHAGRTRETFRMNGGEYLSMLATGSAYAFDAHFSEGILKSLEEPLRKSDQRIDRRAGGITYRKLFENARRYVISNPSRDNNSQDPKMFGDYAGTLLTEAPVFVPKEFNAYASSRSIYARVYQLLVTLASVGPIDLGSLRLKIQNNDLFLLFRGSEFGDRFISLERLRNYIDFLREARWIVSPTEQIQLTAEGRTSMDTSCFNEKLLNTIAKNIFPENLNYEVMDEIVSELLSDMIPPTPIKIKERAAMKGISIKLTSGFRVALQLLPSTGRFMKGSSDAIYPAESGLPPDKGII